MNSIHLEKNFEDYIARKISKLDGWEYSENDNGFDPNTALYFTDFEAYLRATEPNKIEKLEKSSSTNWRLNVTLRLVKALEEDGTVRVLRNGFQMAGYQTITCSGHKPKDNRNPQANVFYEKNILRVMRQVHYQTAGNNSIDLVFFINGIPVATCELKSDLTQSVQDAISQYMTDRHYIEPGTKRKNWLLAPKRGAVVHFAMSESQIYMCTELRGKESVFLPFNRGDRGHAGNPPITDSDQDYPTGYFWNEICLQENWLSIFHSFIFEATKSKRDKTGRAVITKKMIFPRYHQWDCVTKVLTDIREKRTGQTYLIEHSAGSGKSNTIAWIAQELSDLRSDSGERYFSSIIVVTDSIVLDTNIKDAVKQLGLPKGYVSNIGGDGHKKAFGSKSSALETVLEAHSPIIIVTLQTFPYALEAIASKDELRGKNFSVLIDEAHNSQTGKASGMMKTALKLASTGKGDNPLVDDEDLVNEYLKAITASRAMPSNISFFAFTATPKQSTVELFGIPTDEIDPDNGLPIKRSFHLYPMRQAIEEGFILDVLRGYMPYSTAYHLDEVKHSEELVDVATAKKTIAKWAAIHPTNVTQKVEFIVEHFVHNVAKLLNGEAKAMIVTSSRAMVIRYKKAFDKYLTKHPEYSSVAIAQNLQFMIPGEPLVAFSGDVKGSEAIMAEDSAIPDNPFADLIPDFDYNEGNMNRLGNMDIAQAFDTPTYRMLIVANKFQTGFNQPKLVAMYVDKPIANEIEIVQTYSRLNRTYPGKEGVFIIDFVNKPEQVLKAFKMYDSGATIVNAQDYDVVYKIKRELDDIGIYTDEQLKAFKIVRYKFVADLSDDKDASRKSLFQAVEEPAKEWNARLFDEKNAVQIWKARLDISTQLGDRQRIDNADLALKEARKNLQILLDFKKRLGRFCSVYTYISQIIDFGDPDLESFSTFANVLRHCLDGIRIDEVDITGIVMSGYKINELHFPEEVAETEAVLQPITGNSGSHVAKSDYLSAIINSINEIFGGDVPVIDGAMTLNLLADKVAADDTARMQIRNSTNSKDSIIGDGRIDYVIKETAVELKSNSYDKVADRIITDPQVWKPIADIVYDLVLNKKRIDMEDLQDRLWETRR